MVVVTQVVVPDTYVRKGRNTKSRIGFTVTPRPCSDHNLSTILIL